MAYHQHEQSNKKNLDNTRLLLGIASVVIVVLILFIVFNQNHTSSSSSTTIIRNATTSLVNSNVNTTTIVQAVDNPTNYNGQAPVIFTQSTTLTGNIVTTSNITILLRGVVVNTEGYSLISGGTFDNQGSVATGLATNGNESATYSYGGSGGGGWAFGCGNAGGGSAAYNGGSSVVAGGSGLNNGFDQAAGSGTSGSTPSLILDTLDIQTMYNNNIRQYLEGAGGGSAYNCGSTESGGSGSYGVYIQADNVIAGNINAAAQSGSGANEEASGGGGGGAILISYGLGGYLSGTYNYSGGAAGIATYGKAGSGGSGGVIIYSYSSSPPITP
jgi:hypothetical protein